MPDSTHALYHHLSGPVRNHLGQGDPGNHDNGQIAAEGIGGGPQSLDGDRLVDFRLLELMSGGFGCHPKSASKCLKVHSESFAN